MTTNEIDTTLGEACEELLDVWERKLDGEALAAREQALLAEHPASCPACRRAMHGLELLATPPATGPEKVARLTDRAYQVRDRGRARRRWGAALAMAASVAAAVTVGRLVLWPGSPESAAPLQLLAGALHDTAGRVTTAVPGEARELVAGEEGATLVDADETRFHLRRRTRAVLRARRSLELRRGAVAVVVAKRSPGGALEVETPHGTVQVTGTIFHVESDAQRSRVDVLRGSVRVRRKAPPTREITVTAGQSYAFSEEAVASLGDDRERAIQALIDGGPEPAVERSQADAPDRAEPSAGDRGKRAERVRRRPPSVEQLLTRARACLAEKKWQCALRAYDQLEEHHAKHDAVVTTAVSRGSLELDQLGDSRAALRHFNLYLRRRPGGALESEAVLGKARALQSLGRSGEEAETLRSFVERYPLHPGAARARARLREIGAK